MLRTTTIALVLLGPAAHAPAAVSPEEAKQLGTTLTAVGAEKAGNKDGTIPEYTGGMREIPAAYRKGSGIRPSPFDGERPRLVIDAKSAASQAEKLTEGTKELLRRFPASMRVDVYPTHRVVALPPWILANTAKNAEHATTVNGGLAVEGMLPGIPFPIPKSGHEAMWNHLLRYVGVAYTGHGENWNMDAAGVASLSSASDFTYEYPLYNPRRSGAIVKDADPYFMVQVTLTGPARRAGEQIMAIDAVNPIAEPRNGWQYLPGQRRVKLAPQIAYDTPNAGSGGTATFSDNLVFNGAMDRYDWRLVGKREMYVPYNNYKLLYTPDVKSAVTPNHVNPDFMRWEVHRVWVVEATVKPGQRDLYGKRVFYLDEDSWGALAADQYDAKGQLFRATFAGMTYSYDAGAPSLDSTIYHDFATGAYSATGLLGSGEGLRYIDPLPELKWTPESMGGAGIR